MGMLWTGLELLLLLCIVFNLSSCCPGTSPKFGNMTADYEIEVGSVLKIQCSLFTNVIPINGTEYFVASENLMIKFGETFLKNLTVVDELTVQYVLPNASESDTGVYYCFLSIPQLKSNPFICTTEVAVGYPPLTVTNFTCIGLGYERLNCSWDKPHNPVKTKYVLFDYFYAHSALRRQCPIVHENSCEFQLGSNPPYRKSPKTLNLILVGSNVLGKNEQYITIDHFKIVRPHEPQRVTIMNVTKSSVVVHWLPPRGMEYNDFPPGLNYMLHYCPLFGNHPELCGVVSQQNKTSIHVVDLIPFMEYKFMLRCRSNVAEDDNMWSPFTNATVRTEPDVPYLAPVTATSSFQVQNTQSNRTITLYWKTVPSCYENGNDFQYVVYYHLYYMEPRSKRASREVVVGNQTSFSFVNMDPESAYYFRIFSKNGVGVSSNSSVVVVDKAENLPHGPVDISVISYGQGEYNISWKNSPQNALLPIQNYTLFWCQNIKPRPFRCEGPLEWTTVLDTYSELNLSDSKTNYQFAVAANSLHSTSGLKWASCVVPYRGVLYKVGDVILTPKNSTSIRVHWTLDCSAQKSVVQEYAISYCAVHTNRTCSGPNYIVYLNKTLADQHIIGNLEPYTTYKFTVAARTADGWSEDSSIKYESTMPSAPSDSPQNVRLLKVNGTSMKIGFRPPSKPNGKISQYSILYGRVLSLNHEMHKIDFPVDNSADIYEAEINRRGVFLYTNYSIEVEACVGMACSPRSKPVYAFTGIGAPGPLEPPHAEIINATLVNITWKMPTVPNGPIDFYQLMMWREGGEFDDTAVAIFNISGHDTYLSVDVNCEGQSADGLAYYFSLRAINVKNDVLLFGPFSENTQTRLCFIGGNGLSYRVLVGLIIGIAFGLTVLVISVYALGKWMKKKVDTVRGIIVNLPPGLDSPEDNPLHNPQYSKFKSGLQMDRDNGIPSERAYERLCSYVSDKLSAEIDNSLDATAEECITSNSRREKSGRNQSGDSNISGKGHDSISSANTNKTHVSIDSGAEVDLPPSPDGLTFSDTSSSNTTPRSYKPDLEIVEENLPSSSVDSGLHRETCDQVSPPSSKLLLEQSPRYSYYIRKKGPAYLNPSSFKRTGQMPPYCKIAIVSPAITSHYVGVHNVRLLEQQSLANSEPSVAEFQDDNDSAPLMVSGVPPYCRFGLARSAGNGLNITNQSLPVQENHVGYSKFGIIYSALGKPSSSGNQNSIAAPNYSKITCPKFMSNGNNMPFLGQSLVAKKQLKAVDEKADIKSVEKLNAQNSSHGVQDSSGSGQEKNKAVAGNSYVSFNQALSDAANVRHPTSNKPNGYVSFHDAKVLSEPCADCNVSEVLATENSTPDPQSSGNDCSDSMPLEHASPKEHDGLLMELSDFVLPNQGGEDISVPFNDCPSEPSSDLPSEGFKEDITALDLSQLLGEDFPGHNSDDSLECIDVTGISPADSQAGLSPVVNDSPSLVVKYRPCNGYVKWPGFVEPNPLHGTKSSHVEHV